MRLLSIVSLPWRVARLVVLGLLFLCYQISAYLIDTIAPKYRPVLTDSLIWTCQVVWPALKRLADSDLRDFRPLFDAEESLPSDERDAWSRLVLRLCDAKKELEKTSDIDARARIFLKLLKVLNDNWFVPRRLLLLRDSTVDVGSGTEIWELAPVVVGRIMDEMRFSFPDGMVPTYHWQRLYPPLTKDSVTMGFYDGVMNCAIVDWGACNEHVMFTRMMLNEDYRATRTKGDASQPLDHWVNFCQSYCNCFSDVYAQLFHESRAALVEELRHGIDSIRAHRALPTATGIDYYLGLPEVLLAPESPIRKSLWEPLTADPSSMPEDRQRFGRTISEVSAKMTAAALVADPRIAFLEWFVLIEAVIAKARHTGASVSMTEPKAPAYHATTLIIRIVAGVLRLMGESIEANLNDPVQVRSLRDKLLEKSPEFFRALLKEIYRREFAYNQIDEPPFPEIDEDGKLHSERFYAAMGQADALPE